MNVQFHIHGFGQFDRTHAIGPCAWPHFDLLTVHAGRVWIELMQSERVELSRKQSILIFPHTRFEGASKGKRSEVTVMHFGLKASSQANDPNHPLTRLSGRSRGYEVYGGSLPDQLMTDIRRAVSMAHEQATGLTQALREALLILILGQLAESSREHRADAMEGASEFAPLIHWMTSDLKRQVTLDEMAAFLGYSSSHFRAQFVKQVGRSPAMFLRQVRHLEAGRMLRETQKPIKEVSRHLGYDDLSHFYRFFTRMAGMTPLAYRQRYQLRG